jgi:hypothetical protein
MRYAVYQEPAAPSLDIWEPEEVRVPVDTAIEIMRRLHPEVYRHMSDALVLEDYLQVNWGYVIEVPDDPKPNSAENPDK